jgi:hypothetical protein
MLSFAKPRIDEARARFPAKVRPILLGQRHAESLTLVKFIEITKEGTQYCYTAYVRCIQDRICWWICVEYPGFKVGVVSLMIKCRFVRPLRLNSADKQKLSEPGNTASYNLRWHSVKDSYFCVFKQAIESGVGVFAVYHKLLLSITPGVDI